MEFFGELNVATASTGHSPTWYDAVNSEFHYDQHRKQDMHSKEISNVHIYTTANVANPVFNVTESHLTTPATESTQINMKFFQQPIPMDYINGDNHLPSLSSASLYADDNSAMAATYAPCQGPQPWNFAQCYGFYDQPPCPLVNIIDMEDFM